MKILIAVPAYNCSNQIGRVIQQYTDSECKYFEELLIIDNCSSDTTLINSIEFANQCTQKKISIIRNEANYGLGGSHKVAFKYTADKGYEGLVILHGDDQGRLIDIEPHLNKLDLAQYDCILGSRFMTGSRLIGYSKTRIVGNYLFNWLYSLCAKEQVCDLGSGLNYFSNRLLKENIHAKMPDDLTFNSAYLLGIIASKRTLKFIPITWREEDQISNVKLVSQTAKLISYLFKYLSVKKNFLKTDFRDIKRDNYPYIKIK